MRGSVRCDDFHEVGPIGKQAGVERISFVVDLVFQQQPASVILAAVEKRVDHLVVVVVVSIPLDTDRVAIANAGNGIVGALRSGIRTGSGVSCCRAQRGLVVDTGGNVDVVNVGSDVFGEVIEKDAVHARSYRTIQ